MESTPGYGPPDYQKQRGRPLTKRIRKGAYKRKETKCSNCGGTKHNARTCRNAPKNTQRQRAQDRHLASSTDSDSTLDSSESDQESDTRSLNSEILQEMQFQAEMDRYDFVMARAHEIVERRRREELEDNNILADEDNDSDTDSELSVLASSLFNGMDGLEYSGMGGGDIEDSNMDGGDIDGGELDSGDDSTSAPEIAFSPRKMRSGKVVRYHDEK